MAMGDLDIVWKDGRRAYDRYVRVYRQNGRRLARDLSTDAAVWHDRAPAAS